MEPLLKVEGLEKRFKEGAATIHAVNGVSFEINPGEAVGLVGESGCGKTTVARCIMRLTQSSAGRILFDGQDLLRLRGTTLRRQRRGFQMVFQDPSASLNPRFTARRTLSEPVVLHGIARGADAEERVRGMVGKVNLSSDYLPRYPHQLSGGQKQRVGIARSLITEPRFVVLDEPTSSLDMSVRIYVIDLLRRLQQSLGVAYLFISHDLSTVRFLCDRVMVMYLGRIVEMGPTAKVFAHPRHVYTQALLSAIPIADPAARRERLLLKGETPSPRELKQGCGLQDRCPLVRPECLRPVPFYALGGGHRVACVLASDGGTKRD
ncbi:MAG TPA: oligopeptide/dipeptide ABC transporter ATP-binding protein [Spirochaetia bacterium]|nr:oligopeptide/dipeptide ABC transporter ATP-binding protein [Spirochaetia bacterium]